MANKVTIELQKDCEWCRGTGIRQYQDGSTECRRCSGEGHHIVGKAVIQETDLQKIKDIWDTLD